MKILQIIVLVLFPNITFAADHFTHNVDISNWDAHNLGRNISLTSKYSLPKHKVIKYKRAYKDIKRRFEKFTGMSTENCNRSLDIRVVSIEALSNKRLFPYESEYSDEETGQYITGRYFSSTNIMYMIPMSYYINWKSSFAHELAHHFFDACAVTFINDYVEHKAILPFEESFK